MTPGKKGELSYSIGKISFDIKNAEGRLFTGVGFFIPVCFSVICSGCPLR